MAARKHLSHDTKTRDKIRTSQLINRLERFVLSETEQGVKVELSPAQVTAALGLIKKTLPDISAIQHSGDSDNPIRTIQEIALVAPAG